MNSTYNDLLLSALLDGSYVFCSIRQVGSWEETLTWNTMVPYLFSFSLDKFEMTSLNDILDAVVNRRAFAADCSPKTYFVQVIGE